ncbi:hypothetical protein AAKU67_004402 [Oxalobacteraceae bacterium GrIS 2.11]
MDVLTIVELEKIINALRQQNPSDTRTFSNCADVNILATLYGQMIHCKLGAIGINLITVEQRGILEKKIRYDVSTD